MPRCISLRALGAAQLLARSLEPDSTRLRSLPQDRERRTHRPSTKLFSGENLVLRIHRPYIPRFHHSQEERWIVPHGQTASANFIRGQPEPACLSVTGPFRHHPWSRDLGIVGFSPGSEMRPNKHEPIFRRELISATRRKSSAASRVSPGLFVQDSVTIIFAYLPSSPLARTLLRATQDKG